MTQEVSETKREGDRGDFDSYTDRSNGKTISQSISSHLENLKSYPEENATAEEDPCLPVIHLTNGRSNSLVNNEGGERYHPKKKTKILENRVREILGLTHRGFLVGLALAVALLILLISTIALGATWPKIPHRQRFPICIKSTCLRSSALALSKLDRTQSPCGDFYNFTCGQWMREHFYPPPMRSKWDAEEEMNLKMSESIRDIISVLPSQTRINSLTWKIRNFYDSCMALNDIEAYKEIPLRKIIDELGGWSVLRNTQVLSWDFSKTLVKLFDEYEVEPFFSVTVVADPRNATKNIIKVSPSGLGLPDINYYYRGKDDRVSSSYRRYMKDIALLLGAISTDAHYFSEDLFYFERRIAEITPSLEELENVRGHQILTLIDLRSLAPSVPLTEILHALFTEANINDKTEILASSSRYLSKISNIISTTDRKALNNYIVWMLVKKYLPYLSQNFQDVYSFYIRETTGVRQPVDRWEFCIKTMQTFMDVGLVAQVSKANSAEERSENVRVVREIFENVRQAVRESITRAQWIDLDLYKYYISKLDNTTVQIGFPEENLEANYLDEYYSKLYVQNNGFFQNILYGVSYLQEEKMRMYANPKKEYSWLSSIASGTRVVFIPSANKILVPQKLLLKPFFEPEYPVPVLYGILGVGISRELVSSLLNYSGLYAANGSLIEDKSLVANLSSSSIAYQTKCLGDLAVANNITTEEMANKISFKIFAAISAVKQALKALKKVTTGTDHIHQAGLEDFDNESLFYIAFGQSLFSVKTMQENDKDTTVGSTLSGKQLLQMIKLQLKSFAEAFDCEPFQDTCKHIL